TSRDTSSKDSPRNSRNTTSILRFADHLGFDRKSPASSLDTDMSTMLAPLYRLSNDSGCGGRGHFGREVLNLSGVYRFSELYTFSGLYTLRIALAARSRSNLRCPWFPGEPMQHEVLG